MKHYFLIFILAVTFVSAFGQDTTEKKVYKNEFGIDATSFLKQFLNFNTGEYYNYYYSPMYYLTYRRKICCGNLRSAFGGSFSDYDINSSNQSDSNKYHYRSCSLNMRAGWEYFSDLGKRWQVFYGIDFRTVFNYTKNDASYWNGGYANGYENKSQIYTLAPLIGFRYYINSRLSISTEASFLVNREIVNNRKYYKPVISSYPELPDVVTPKTKKTTTWFSQPVSIFLTFDI